MPIRFRPLAPSGARPTAPAWPASPVPIASLALALTVATPAMPLAGQQPAGWGAEPLFHTFSIVALDRETGELGVAVTTRNTCVGNGVPWVRAGVGAVATQAATRVEYGTLLLDRLAEGGDPAGALEAVLADDGARARRQLGVVDAEGRTAQHTGSETNAWAGHRAGDGFAVQGNLLAGPQVLDSVVAAFERSSDSGRHLADRLVSALEAGQAAGGDARRGRLQSAAVLVADPREGVASRPDGQSVFIHVCEHPSPVAELRRVYDTSSGTLGFRTLQQYSGRDVAQLQIMLHALGYLEAPETPGGGTTFEPDGVYDATTVEAVERFRADRGLSTARNGSPAGLVEPETVEALWATLAERGLERDVREQLRTLTLIRR